MTTNFPLRKPGWRAALASVLAAFWLTACGGGDSAPVATALATSSSSGQAAAQLPVAGQAPTAVPAQMIAPAQGQVQEPATAPGGAEFRVNTTMLGIDQNSSIARLKSGGHVVAWISNTELFPGVVVPPSARGVCTQRYGVDGQALGQETCIAPDAVFVNKPALAALEDGGYLLVWPVRQANGGGEDHNLLAQRFDANGIAVRAVQQINSITLSSKLFSSVAAAGLADGGYVVTWRAPRTADTSLDIYARRFDAQGVACPCGAEKRVNTFTDLLDLAFRTTAVAALADGGYLVTWDSSGPSGLAGSAIYTQRYGANNSPIGSPTLITPDAFGDQLGASFPAVSGLAGGGYAVTYVLALRETDPVIAVQSFHADGSALAAPSLVNPVLGPRPTCTRQGRFFPCPRPVASPAVAALDDGGFVVAWSEGSSPGPTPAIFVSESQARRYGADGAPAGAPGRVAASGVRPAVSATSLGGFVVVFSQVRFGGSSNDGIFARYFDAQAFRGSAAP
ncbi:MULTISPECIES: hypothetical protein [unclassified Polaromonas]|uniref:hypothetical protein n=1 Tax=unclassified Polaromonas TaxID=2638319 RepID=UPI0018CA0086|nr:MULTISPECIES: hypothetical protein [unclassified Polaromonas]MBG6072197.1 hypothetical protein [Polaromonas sp. CG_9.7]MBG6114372.1 hypothetical protein [Polaromonas sp. CG_9.2]MDH6182669.1 hypothetical protein [Polaromonas sp. CG_23.6]